MSEVTEMTKERKESEWSTNSQGHSAQCSNSKLDKVMLRNVRYVELYVVMTVAKRDEEK